MNGTVNFILDILKITIPAGIVFATVYYMLKQFFANQIMLKQIELNKDVSSETLPLRLQAYERLMLFCDRISPQSLIYRLNSTNMTVGSLQNALLIGIQQEYEHNLTQQIYVSDQLWKIISFSKTEVQALVTNAAYGLDIGLNSGALVEKILEQVQDFKPNDLAKKAIKEEIKLIL